MKQADIAASSVLSAIEAYNAAWNAYNADPTPENEEEAREGAEEEAKARGLPCLKND